MELQTRQSARQTGTVAVIQARMNSQRLPGKVMMKVGPNPILGHVVKRLRRCRRLDLVTVATTERGDDQPIRDFCDRYRIPWIAGSEADVLGRYRQAARTFDAERIVRVTADCPFIDPDVVDRTIRIMTEHPDVDYASNVFPRRSFPRGLDCEVVTREALDRVSYHATEPRYREHVTLLIHDRHEEFHTMGWTSARDHSELRWTVDTPEDLELIRSIYDYFGHDRFGWQDILNAYDFRPDWRAINAHVMQKVA